jgi:hypothetical protein
VILNLLSGTIGIIGTIGIKGHWSFQNRSNFCTFTSSNNANHITLKTMSKNQQQSYFEGGKRDTW